MTENKRYSFNWERGHPNFWDNHCNLADCYLTCEDVVDKLNELNDFKDNVFKVIDKKIEWHLLQSKKCRNQGNIKKAIKFEEAIMTLDILRRDIE